MKIWYIILRYHIKAFVSHDVKYTYSYAELISIWIKLIHVKHWSATPETTVHIPADVGGGGIGMAVNAPILVSSGREPDLTNICSFSFSCLSTRIWAWSSFIFVVSSAASLVWVSSLVFISFTVYRAAQNRRLTFTEFLMLHQNDENWFYDFAMDKTWTVQSTNIKYSDR